MKRPTQKPNAEIVEKAARTKGLLVLGMHRSGTSALTRVLNLLGCVLADDLIGEGDGNETGHWEAVAAVTVNDAILESAGSTWEDWGPINEDWRQSGVRAEMVARITSVVRDHAALGPLFAIKDPRLCRLADLWLEAMVASEVEPLVVFMLRNPAEVCASLEQRDLMAPGYGQLLWLRHVLDAEHFSRGVPRVFCCYDGLMRNWHGEVDRIKNSLGIALPRNAPATHLAIEQFLSRQHRHHELGNETVLNSTSLSGWLRRTYAIMSAWHEQSENASDYAELDHIRDEFDRAYSTFASLLLGAGVSGSVGSGHKLRRELSEQLQASKIAADSAARAVGEAEAQQVAAAEHAAQLQAQLQANLAHSQQLEVELNTLRVEAERAASLAADVETLRASEAELAKEVSRLDVALRASQAATDQERQNRCAAEQTLAARVAELHDQEVRAAELAGRASTAESALVQRQEELAQLWNSLLAAERNSAAAESRAELEHNWRLDGERRLEAAVAEAADLRSRLDAVLFAPAPAPDHLIAEIAQLTRMLQEQEEMSQIASTARLEAEQALAKQVSENYEMQARMQQQEAANHAAEAARAQTEQKLATRFEEIARLTAILADESSCAADTAADVEWLRNMMQLAGNFPKWWALMPEQWRRQREHARYRSAGLFDAERYLETYPDVAANGMDPVRHYILHGIPEGRQRHQ